MEQIETLNGIYLQQALMGGPSEVDILKARLADLTKETNQFTYIITHDLQAPLRMVAGFLELLEKKYGDKLDDGGKQYIDYAVKGSQKMKTLIFDLLEYSRLSSIVQEYEEIDMNELLIQVKEKMSPEIGRIGAIIISGELPKIRGSRKQLSQLMEELLTNAIKFNNSDTPEISIGAERTDEYWKISVTDNGIGIDPAFFERIFIIFKRLHADESIYEGTGTGLAICKKIAELHGGTIQLSSAPGKGSTFYFKLPLS
jgi:light-regulated signal transduction histidine kinase (bacteriophytochrome)